jgi:hypothetical protein
MSSKRNKRRRRQLSEVPVLVERIQKVEQHHDTGVETSASGKTYEEANWARLSPLFRNAHNKLRQARGLPTLPPPAIDLYVPPKAPLIKPFDPTDKEFVAATREFLGSTLMGGTDEGFTINGRLVK